MLSSSLHLALAAAMVLLGAGAAWIMLEAFGGRTPKEASARRAALHRALGRTFAIVYLVLLVSMLKLALGRSSLEPLEAAHATLGLTVLPVLGIKVLVVRRWAPLHRFLPLFGCAVLALTVVTAGLGFVMAGRGGGKTPAAELEALPEHPGRAPFLRYCAQCHALSRPLGLAASQRPTEGAWSSIVGTMRARAASRGREAWTDEEAAQIAAFLSQVGQGQAAAPGGVPAGGGEAGDDRGRGRGRGGRDGR